MKFLVYIVFLIEVARGQFLNCGWVNSLDCDVYVSEKECGTDGLTYPNRCFFAQAQCKNSDLHILHDGACTAAETSTTPAPNSNVDGDEAVLDFFCNQLSHQDCPVDQSQPICATDGWTYPNYCEYEKARCTHRNLHVQYYGACQ